MAGLIQLNTPFLSGKGTFMTVICNGHVCASGPSSVLPLPKHRTISTSIAKLVCGAYTSTDWHWIFTGATSFMCNNWITLLRLTFYCVCSRPAIFRLIVWWYNTVAVPCHDWEQTLCMCLLQQEIRGWLMLFRMNHTVDLFLKLFCSIICTLMMNHSGFIYLWSILTEILCAIQFFWYRG